MLKAWHIVKHNKNETWQQEKIFGDMQITPVVNSVSKKTQNNKVIDKHKYGN